MPHSCYQQGQISNPILAPNSIVLTEEFSNQCSLKKKKKISVNNQNVMGTIFKEFFYLTLAALNAIEGLLTGHTCD